MLLRKIVSDSLSLYIFNSIHLNRYFVYQIYLIILSYSIFSTFWIQYQSYMTDSDSEKQDLCLKY